MSRRAASPRTLVLLSGTLMLGACGGSLLQSKLDPPSIYLLSAHPGARGAAIAADLTVLKPEVRAGLRTDRIAALYPDRRLDYFAGARWSAPLDEVIQQLAIDSFRAHANLRTVVGDASTLAPANWLELEVVDFQAEYAAGGGAPTIRAGFVARLEDARGRRVLQRFEAHATRKAADNRLAAIIAAYEQAADTALDEIVAATARALAGNRRTRAGH
ncbi:MAG TPA: ABC-type transport auxiliary lipoprotein family protein [Steroidobacteraceae bacterium]|nr:ABC-type transport auxiliary lipoprotein family protein [Steroidobacteraceae bacterium]